MDKPTVVGVNGVSGLAEQVVPSGPAKKQSPRGPFSASRYRQGHQGGLGQLGRGQTVGRRRATENPAPLYQRTNGTTHGVYLY
jgi:hypothetical protein